jgi:hypothetical protein
VSYIDLSKQNHQAKEHLMAKKTMFVSDFTGKAIADDKESATATVKFGDGRRGVVVADAKVDDPIIAQVIAAGRQQARRGRRPKAAA